MTWRVGARPARPLTGFELVIHIANCRTMFRALTPAQRRRLLDPDSPAHPRVVKALRDHGLVDEAGALTEAAEEIRRWNLPPDQTEEAA